MKGAYAPTHWIEAKQATDVTCSDARDAHDEAAQARPLGSVSRGRWRSSFPLGHGGKSRASPSVLCRMLCLGLAFAFSALLSCFEVLAVICICMLLGRP